MTVQDNCTLSVDAVGDTLVHSTLGGHVELSVVVTGAVGSVTCQWSREDVSKGGKTFNNILGATGATLVIDPVVAESEDIYMCSVSDAMTSVDGPIVTLMPPAEHVPAVGLFGLALVAAALGLGGTFTRRRRRR